MAVRRLRGIIVCDLESERSLLWADGQNIYCKDTDKLYVINNDAYVQIGGGGGSTSITEVEIDFGSVPIKSKKFTITDATIAPTHKITATLSYANPSDSEEDGAEWFEDLALMARADTGQFFLYANSPYNDLNGKVKINYIKG